MIAGFALCLTIGYAVGRYTAPREPFYLIGTPLDANANSNEASKAHAQDGARQSVAGSDLSSASSANATAQMCGARTKTGRPCKRKVAGGGYCWQHRNKNGPKKPPARAQ